jgi:hypothetical protein
MPISLKRDKYHIYWFMNSLVTYQLPSLTNGNVRLNANAGCTSGKTPAIMR